LRVARLPSPADVGLTPQEYDRIRDTLGRDPNTLELGMFGVLWSEHCSYKHSKPLLRRLPTSGRYVLQGPGENAGAVDVGDGLAAVMKMESHNHPSAVEPLQGAATGVGGILRDIFTMGARPIALMDALCFGSPDHPRTDHLLNGVVSGIAFYGNCVGVPTVGGSVAFDASYNGNPLVNVLCLGITRRDRIISSRASGPGNPVLLVGSDTGRDGIAGASFASAELSADTEEQRPAVQVGNPFLEKLLIEACLELADDPAIVAMQDLGAAGLTGAATETVANGTFGIDVDIARVSRREQGMTPEEVMLSESQERMLIVAQRGEEERIQRVFERWGLRSDVIGHITDTGLVRVLDGARVVAELPASFLSGGVIEYAAPITPSSQKSKRTHEQPPFAPPTDCNRVLLDLLALPNICSKRTIFEQYDHMVQINTVVPPGEGAGVLRIKGTNRGLALGLGDAGSAGHVNAWAGGAMAVAEACRNVSCAGATPIALTDCLNFGDPERPAVWQAMVDAVEGIRDACLALDVPIISGNVSLYNESEGAPIRPTPMLGAVGVIEDLSRYARAAIQEGQTLWLLGPLEGALPLSQYALYVEGWTAGEPATIDLDLERRVQACVRELIGGGIVTGATDVSEGGLAIALAELALASLVGVDCTEIDTTDNGTERTDAVLFGEGPSRIIIAAGTNQDRAVQAAAASRNVPLTRMGKSGGEDIRIGGTIDVSVERAHQQWAGGLDHMADKSGGRNAAS
jgi:phosphoribosylformylglycinamidine synthase subunit PurL